MRIFFRTTISVFFLLAAAACVGQDSIAVSMADTTNFRVNREANWVLYNSYLATFSTDSAFFEVIVRHEKAGVNWSEPQYIGSIKNTALFPSVKQQIDFPLLSDIYLIQIDINGKCYMNLKEGHLPLTDPVVIPIQVRFRING